MPPHSNRSSQCSQRRKITGHELKLKNLPKITGQFAEIKPPLLYNKTNLGSSSTFSVWIFNSAQQRQPRREVWSGGWVTVTHAHNCFSVGCQRTLRKPPKSPVGGQTFPHKRWDRNHVCHCCELLGNPSLLLNFPHSPGSHLTFFKVYGKASSATYTDIHISRSQKLGFLCLKKNLI